MANKHKESLGTLRTRPGLSAAEYEDEIWLLVSSSSRKTDPSIGGLPARQTFRLDEENRLFPVGSLTPTATLPDLKWYPLKEFLPVEPPVSAQPAQVTQQLPFRLLPSENTQSGYALICSLAQWQAYAQTAPQSRLERLEYCLSGPERVLIAGNPLPPIPGQEYWRSGQFLLPAGFDLEFPLLANAASNALQADRDALLLFDKLGGWEQVPLAHFVRASRSSIAKISHESPGTI